MHSWLVRFAQLRRITARLFRRSAALGNNQTEARLELAMQYIALIHKNTDAAPSTEDWDQFILNAGASGMFQGGSEIGTRKLFGQKSVFDSTESIGGYMIFETEYLAKLEILLLDHPVVRNGGSIELCELPLS